MITQDSLLPKFPSDHHTHQARKRTNDLWRRDRLPLSVICTQKKMKLLLNGIIIFNVV